MKKNKMTMVFTVVAIAVVATWSMACSSPHEKHQSGRDQIYDVKERVKAIEINDPMIGSVARVYAGNGYLVIFDARTPDEQIHLFDLNDWHYVVSFGMKGQGPRDLTNVGRLFIDDKHHAIYIHDLGKTGLLYYPIDSILNNKHYLPEIRMKTTNTIFPSQYFILNYSLMAGIAITLNDTPYWGESPNWWNLNTGQYRLICPTHPSVERPRIQMAISQPYQLLVISYNYHDLFSIIHMDGSLKYHVYGPDWNDRTSNAIHYYGKPVFCKNRILISYSGGYLEDDTYFPTKFLVFDLNGDYIRTLDIGYKISDFCYDEQNHRLILNFDDMIQFGYLDLNELIE